MRNILRSMGMVSFLALAPAIVHGQTSVTCSPGCVTMQGYDNNRDNVNSTEDIFLASTLGSSHMSDMDLDAGGLILAAATGGVLPTGINFAVVAGGKEGVIYVLDPTNMGSNAAPNGPDPGPAPCKTATGALAIQCFGGVRLKNYNVMTPQSDATGSRCSPAFWAGNTSLSENYLYFAGSDDNTLWGYKMGSGGSFNVTTVNSYSFGATNYLKYPGACPVVTWNTGGGSGAAGDAILWVMLTGDYTLPKPVTLLAFKALPTFAHTFGSPLINDSTNGPGAMQFSEPTVVDGYVFAAGQQQTTLCTTGVNTCKGMVVSWH